MLRKPYQPKQDLGRSLQNEPMGGTYPDMYKVYQKFSDTHGISTDNFILTNGCENALRICLEVLRPKCLGIETPSWELPYVFATGMRIKTKPFKVHYDETNRRFYYGKMPRGIDVLYYTQGLNNFASMVDGDIDDNDPFYNPPDYVAIINDLTYYTPADFGAEVREPEQISIGSFSKYVDPSLRLGYIIFHKSLKEEFNLLREQYLNSAAVDFILNTTPADMYNIFRLNSIPEEWPPELSNKIVSNAGVYTTFRADNVPYPHKKFIVDGITFCRVGRITKGEKNG